MALVFADGNADDNGRRRVTLIHHQPDLLGEERRAQGVEVADVDPPEVGPDERATPYLNADDEFEWVVEERPEAKERREFKERVNSANSLAALKAVLTGDDGGPGASPDTPG